MKYPKKLNLRTNWGGRMDTIAETALNTWQCWQRLAARGEFMATTWRSLHMKARRRVRLGSLDELTAFMSDSYAEGEEGDGFLQVQEDGFPDDAEPCMMMRVMAGVQRGGLTMAANNVFMQIDNDYKDRPVASAKIAWTLERAVGLMEDFVDLWRPDYTSLDSLDILGLQPKRDSAIPIVGYVSWFSDDIVDPDHLPDAPVKHRFHNGTIIGIDPKSTDPVADATALAVPIYESGILKRVPYVQGQPEAGPLTKV